MGEVNPSPMFLRRFSMKLTITKSNGKKLIKEFADSDIETAKSNGWKEVSKPKTQATKKSKGSK